MQIAATSALAILSAYPDIALKIAHCNLGSVHKESSSSSSASASSDESDEAKAKKAADTSAAAAADEDESESSSETKVQKTGFLVLTALTLTPLVPNEVKRRAQFALDNIRKAQLAKEKQPTSNASAKS